MSDPQVSKRFWNDAAKQNAAWYIATAFTTESDEFFRSGAREVDSYLAFAGVSLNKSDSVLEIGCGAGRMTRRLSELAGSVIGTDVSGEMLKRAEANLASLSNVTFVEVDGDGHLPGRDESVSAVFSYITMQHVPSTEAQRLYFQESIRLLASGGWSLVQFRRGGLVPVALDWAGHVAHRISGRKTFSAAWRGARVRPKDLRSLATDSVRIQILPHGRRHIWALALKS
jgi:SAM-dependent methyltransferase